jgi:hypothetical protein
LKNNEIHSWDRGYDIDGNQVSFCSLNLHLLIYLDEYLKVLLWIEIKAETFNGNAFLVPSLQVWGAKEGPYEFKPVPASSFNDMVSPLDFPPQQSMEKRIQGSFVLQD